MGKRTKICLKLIISIVILCLIFFSVDIESCLAALSNIDIKVFVLLVLLYVIGQIISALKWKVIAERLGFKNNFFTYVKFYFKGMFFNTFLPTNVGGDVMKIAYLKKNDDNSAAIERAFVSVVTDRLSGVLVLVILAFVGVLCINTNDILRLLIISATLAVIFCLLLVLFLCCKKYEFENNILQKVIYYNKLFINRSIIPILLLSLCFHLLVIVIHILIGKTMHLDINLYYYLILYPVTAIAASLPVSLNGIGIKEAAYMYILNLISVTPSQGLIFVFCWNLVVLISSLLGAAFFIEKTD